MEACTYCSKQGTELLLCGGCRQSRYCCRECQKQDWSQVVERVTQHRNMCQQQPKAAAPSKSLSASQVEHLLGLVSNTYLNVFKIIFVMDPSEADSFKARNLQYHQQSHQGHAGGSCCGAPMNQVYVPQNQMTTLEATVYEFTNPTALRSCLEELLEFCHAKLYAIMQKGAQEGLQIDQQTEKYLVGQTMTEGCQAFFLAKIKAAFQRKSKVDAKQPMLMALATTWHSKYPQVKLDFLSAEVLSSLDQKGFALDKHWLRDLSSAERITEELEYFEKDGRFDQVPLPQRSMRNDRVMWVPPNISPGSSLFQVVTKLYSIPFELTSKTSMMCSISEAVQLSYFKLSGFEKGSTSGENGIKFTALLFLSAAKIKLVNSAQEQQLSAQSGSLVIFKNKAFSSMSLECAKDKAYLVRYWINGPETE